MRFIDNVQKFGLQYIFKTIKHKVFRLGNHDMGDNIYKQRYYQNLPQERYAAELSAWYKKATGKELHLDNPVLFTEKIQWLKLYDSTPLKTLCADKYLAPKWVEEQCYRNDAVCKRGGVCTVPILGVWDRAEDIDFTSLPNKFVLKCNHGSGMNIVVTDKVRLDKAKVCRQFDNWLKVDYAHIGGAFELHYSAIPKKIIAEQFIEEMDGNLHDYKFHCFSGEPKFIQAMGNRNLEKHTGFQMFYDTKWEKMPQLVTTVYPPYENDVPRPAVLSQLLEVAKCLSEPFCYVRVDLYVIHDKVYFSEMTFTPDSGGMKFASLSADKMLGNLLVLPNLI